MSSETPESLSREKRQNESVPWGAEPSAILRLGSGFALSSAIASDSLGAQPQGAGVNPAPSIALRASAERPALSPSALDRCAIAR